MTIVLSATPRVSSFFSSTPTCSSCSIILARTASDSARPSSTAFWTYFACGCDQIWIAVVLNQQKNGASFLVTRSSQSSVLSSTSWSKVSMRLRVSLPVSSIVCLPILPNFGSTTVSSSCSVARQCNTPRGPNFFVYSGFFCPG